MTERITEGYCACCGEELVTIWDKGDFNCPTYVDYTNIDDDYEGYCRECIQKIENHDLYKELSDVVYFEASNSEVTLYCRHFGDILAEFVID